MTPRHVAPASTAITAVGAASFNAKQEGRKLSPVDLVPAQPRPRPEARAPFCCSTYASIEATCSDRCPFKGNGCDVSSGAVKRLATELDAAARGYTADQVIAEEARLIDGAFRGGGIPQDGAKGGRDLRLHVGGDVTTNAQARQLAAPGLRWGIRGGGAVWTFTHSWRDVEREAWGDGISVLASVERPEDIEVAREKGYAAAIVVDHFPSEKAFSLPGTTSLIIPCPYETRGTTCVECRLCLDDRDLLKRNAAIAFEAHGPGAKQVREALVQLRRRDRAAGGDRRELTPPVGETRRG